METVLLGKIVKAMYKLSGKTVEQLSEETELSVDTINNFFYARLQKPSFIGVSKLVRATGYTMKDLVSFMDIARELPQDANITDEFAKYLISENDTDPIVTDTAEIQKKDAHREDSAEIKEFYQRELDRLQKIIMLLIVVIAVITVVSLFRL